MRLCSKALLCALILSALSAVQVFTADNTDFNSVFTGNPVPYAYVAVNAGPLQVSQNMGSPVVVWDNGMVLINSTVGSQLELTGPANRVLADDFELPEDFEVNGVNWIGSYHWPGPPYANDYDWKISFYEDFGDSTKPGNLITSMIISIDDIDTTLVYAPGPAWFWYYSARLPSVISFNADTRYWIGIQVVGDIPPAGGMGLQPCPPYQLKLTETMYLSPIDSYDDWTSLFEIFGLSFNVNFQLTYTEPCVWNPGDWVMMDNVQLPNETGWTVNATAPIFMADDWMSIQTAPIEDIHWWGAWENDIEGEILYFILSIYEDIPADQSPTGYSMPGDILWGREIDAFEVVEINPPDPEHWYNPATGYIEANDHQTYYQYNVCIDTLDWFFQAEGFIYWLNISAVVADPENTQWGWKSTAAHWNDDAVWNDGTMPDWQELYEPGPYDYVPGDVTGDGFVNTQDPVWLLNYLAGPGPPPEYAIPGTDPPFYAAADANGDCQVDLVDEVYLDDYLFEGGPPPTFCPLYPPGEDTISLDLAFVITGDPPTGACCFEDGHCEVLEPFNCDAAGGTYRGNSTVCLGDTDPPDGTDDLCAWTCGDVNGTETVNLLDITYLIAFLYMEGPAPEFMDAADVNSSGTVNILDITALISFLYMEGPAPECP